MVRRNIKDKSSGTVKKYQSFFRFPSTVGVNSDGGGGGGASSTVNIAITGLFGSSWGMAACSGLQPDR